MKKKHSGISIWVTIISLLIVFLAGMYCGVKLYKSLITWTIEFGVFICIAIFILLVLLVVLLVIHNKRKKKKAAKKAEKEAKMQAGVIEEVK